MHGTGYYVRDLEYQARLFRSVAEEQDKERNERHAQESFILQPVFSTVMY
jgi:hypothetical protein